MTGRSGPAAGWGGLLCSLLLLAGLQGAAAHHRFDPQAIAAAGLAIPDLTHGQMAVLSSHAAAIRDLAQRPMRTDPTFRRLANYAALQRTYCLWGLMPGSLQDEESPFNECMHAYLAALRALLLHMRTMPDPRDAATALSDTVDLEMIRQGASLILCRYSAEAFNTARVIVPRWQDVLAHPPSLLALAGTLASFAAGAAIAMRPPGGRRAKAPPAS